MKVHRYKIKGEITAFLSLIFVLLVSFILAMTQSAQLQTEKNLRRMAVDRAVYSVFGEYQKELFEEYGVFAIDGTYETGQFEEEQILNRLIYYGSGEVEQTITDIQYLTDNDGQAFREQVLAYMETQTAIGWMENLAGISSQWETQKVEGEQASQELEALWNGENTSLLPEQQEDIQAINATGILSMVMPEGFVLSGKSISEEIQVSKRARRYGRGHFPERTQIDGLKEDLLYHQYLGEKFNSATDQKSADRSLDYEMEYFISGKSSDEGNLREVVKQILVARMGMNYPYLWTDSGKQAEADTLALALATATTHPETKEVFKQLIMLLWAFAESTMDVRSLLSQQKIPMVKNAGNWIMPLSSVFTFWNSDAVYGSRDIGAGMDYEQYLQLLLYLKSTETVTMRTLDRVEENLRREKELPFFTADACISKIKLKNKTQLWQGQTYSFPTYFGYL